MTVILLPGEAKKRTKYGNKKGDFDSNREAKGIRDLVIRERVGEIRNLRYKKEECRQKIVVNGVHVCDYIPDAIYEEPMDSKRESWHEVWLDVKSEATRKNRAYRIKVKLVAAVFGRTVIEVL